MKKPLYYSHVTNKNDFAFIDRKGRHGTAYRVCRAGKIPYEYEVLKDAQTFLEEQGYKHDSNILMII